MENPRTPRAQSAPAIPDARRLFGRWWRRQSPALQDRYATLAPLLSVLLFLATPLTNPLVRIGETEADLFGLNLAREPDDFAEAILKLVEYRKADPGPIEEIVFFDHPSARSRIMAAMRWKAALAPPAAAGTP